MTRVDLYQLKFMTDDEKLAALTAEIARQTDILDKLVAGCGKASQAYINQLPAVAAVKGNLRLLYAEIANVGNALRQTGEESAKHSKALKLLNFSRLADDAQYMATQGLRPIINNLIELSPKLGLAAIGFQILWEAAKPLAAWLGKGATKTEAQHMDELAKATSRTADETARLGKWKEREARMAKHSEAKTELERKQADLVDDAIADAGVDKIKHGLKSSAGADVLVSIDNDARAAAEAMRARETAIREKYALDQKSPKRRATPGDGDTVFARLAGDKDYSEKRAKYDEALGVAASRLLADAATNRDRLLTLRDLVNASPGAFPKGFGDRLDDARPEVIEEDAREAELQKEREAAWHASEARGKLLAKEDKAAAADAARIAKAATEEEKAKIRAEIASAKQAAAITKAAAIAGAKVAKAKEKEELDAYDAEGERDNRAHETYREHKARRREIAGDKRKSLNDLGLGDLMRRQFEFLLENGGNVQGGANALRARLAKQFGAAVGDPMVDDSLNDARRAWMRGELKDESRKDSKSATYGSAAFAEQVQSGVGTQDYVKKSSVSLSKIESAVDGLLESVRNPAPRAAVLK